MVHVPPSAPEKPGLQVQFVISVEDAGDMLFGEHALHALAPSSPEKVPGAQPGQAVKLSRG